MTSLVVERDGLTKIMQEWLAALGIRAGEKVEVIFLSGEAIVRPQSVQNAELDAWLDQATRK